MTPSRRWLGLAAVLLALAPATARGGTPDDIYGVGARNIAMGGSGTALSLDPTAVYYNPANIAFCPTNLVSLQASHAINGMGVDGDLGTAEQDAVDSEDRTRITFAFCSHLPYEISFGILFGVGVQHAMTLDQHTVDGSRMFLLYGIPQDQMSIMAGGSYRIGKRLSVGGGASILVNSELGVPLDVPILATDPIGARVRWDLKPTLAIAVGAHYTPFDRLHVAASYRSALYHKLDAVAPIDLRLVGIELPAEILMEAVSWYSPQQARVGATFGVLPRLSLSADVVWYDWSSYTGPFVEVSPQNDVAAAALSFPPPEELALTDIVVPSFGLEWVAQHGARHDLALRAGFSHRPSVAPVPGTVTQHRTDPSDGTETEEPGLANLLDPSVTSFTAGFGYRFGKRPSRTPIPRYRDGDRDEHGSSASIDFYARLSVTPEIEVPDRDPEGDRYHAYTSSGTLFDLGLTFTLGWW